MKHPQIVATATILATLGLAAVACGGSDDAAVEIEGAWARISPMSAEAGAAYFQISSATDDVLVGASVDESVAATVEIHETRMVEGHGDDAMDDDSMETEEAGMAEGDMEMDMSDVMEMVEVGRIALPAGETVSLEPGGLHVMMLDLAEPLERGATFELTLDFETAEDQVITVTVGDSAPE